MKLRFPLLTYLLLLDKKDLDKLQKTLQTEFKTNPQNAWIAQGDNALLECDPPRGNPEPKVSWKKNGNLIDIKANERYNLVGSGSLSIREVRQSDEGRYQCVTRNIVGSRTSTTALLRVTIRPEFTIRPANTSALLGGEVSLSCVARGDPPPEITWIRVGAHLPLKRVHFDEERFLISNVSESDRTNPVYTCVAENKAGSVTASATINVLPLPKVIMTPSDVQIQPNATAYFSCEAEDGGENSDSGSVALFWLKEGGHTLVFQGSRQDNIQVTPQGTLQIDNVSERDEGFYFCAVMSLAGSIINRVHLKVTPVEELPPPIVLMGPSNQTRPLGAVAVLPCIANGSPLPVVITWYKDGKSFLLSHRVFTDDAGTLRINDLEKADSGLWECVASSPSGKYVWKSQLSVVPESVYSSSNKGSLSNGFTMSITRPPAPSQPFVTKVDAASITISWITIGWHPPPPSNHYQSQSSSSSSSPELEFNSVPKSPSIFEPKKKKPGAEKDLSDKKGSIIDSEPATYIDDEEEYDSLELDSSSRSKRSTEFIGSEADAFFKALERPSRFNSPKFTENESSQEIEASRVGDGTGTTGEEEYEYTDGDDYDEETGGGENGENLVLTTSSTTTTTTTTTTTSTTTPVPSTRKPVTSSFINPREYVNPHQLNKASQPAITYKVEYYSPGESRSEWLLAATAVSETTFTLMHLKANTEYVFFVRSVSPEGAVSGPSPFSIPVTTHHSGSRNTELEAVLQTARNKLGESIVVILKNVYATASTSIRIEWQIVSASEFVEGFYIYYRRFDDIRSTAGTGSYQMLTVLNAGASTFQIVGLDKYATYQVFLVPFYKNVEGRPSNYVNVSTLQDVPNAAPELLEPLAVNGSALLVRWKPPPAAYHNGIILGYQLRVWQSSSLVANKTADSLTTNILLNNLMPGQSYSIQIGAFTTKGIGVFSPMKNVHFSPELKPKKPSLEPEFTNKIDSNPPPTPDSEGNNPKLDNRIPLIPVPTRREEEDLEGIVFGGAAVNANNDVFSEAWFIALIGSIIFAMMLVFVFALYLRRCQIRTDGDKLKVSTTEIPDGSIPPHYTAEESLWIDQKTQLTLKSIGMGGGNGGGMGMGGIKVCGENEYENANNYAVVEDRDRHSPIAYATTTLVNNNQKHKSSFNVFGGGGGVDSLGSKCGLGREFMGGYNKIGGAGAWTSSSASNPNHPSKTSSLSISSGDMKKPPWLLNSNSSPAPNGVIFGGVNGGGSNGPCSSSQSSSSHSSASSEALMKGHNNNKSNTKMSLKSNSASDSKNSSHGHNHHKRRGGSRPSSRSQGREEDHNEYMDMDDPEHYFSEEFKPSAISMGGHVLSTFQTPLPSRKLLVVDFSSGSPVAISSNPSTMQMQQRLNEYEYHQHQQRQQQLEINGGLPQYAHPSHLRNHNHHTSSSSHNHNPYQ